MVLCGGKVKTLLRFTYLAVRVTYLAVSLVTCNMRQHAVVRQKWSVSMAPGQQANYHLQSRAILVPLPWNRSGTQRVRWGLARGQWQIYRYMVCIPQGPYTARLTARIVSSPDWSGTQRVIGPGSGQWHITNSYMVIWNLLISSCIKIEIQNWQ